MLVNFTLPVLYSFRRCPYAIRARLALLQSKIKVEIREVDLSNKPVELTQISPKATVPVLVLVNGKVLDESLDIMLWALQQNDPEQWLDEELQGLTQQLICENDVGFKSFLDKYKYSDRYPEFSREYYRQQGETFLLKLENLLNETPYLLGKNITLVDIAIMPFIRQFAGVDPGWFTKCKYQKLREWLNKQLESENFRTAMQKKSFESL